MRIEPLEFDAILVGRGLVGLLLAPPHYGILPRIGRTFAEAVDAPEISAQPVEPFLCFLAIRGATRSAYAASVWWADLGAFQVGERGAGLQFARPRCKITGIPAFRKKDSMETVKLGKKGQLSIPKGILKRLGLEGDATLLVDTTPEGAIVLRPAAVYPIEIYSDKRIREFDAADRMDAKTAARLARILERK